MTGSRELSNRHIALDATLWDVDEPQLIQGLAELELTRDRRVSADGSLVSISPEPPVIDVWGATALVRHYFEVTLATASGTELMRVRNTSVWREIAGRWVVVHNHEDAIGLGRATTAPPPRWSCAPAPAAAQDYPERVRSFAVPPHASCGDAAASNANSGSSPNVEKLHVM